MGAVDDVRYRIRVLRPAAESFCADPERWLFGGLSRMPLDARRGAMTHPGRARGEGAVNGCTPGDVVADAAPDAELLADLVEAVEEGRPPTQAALEEAVLLAERIGAVATRIRRRKALRRVRELLASGEYTSVREAAPRVARELKHQVGAETIRWWWAERPSIPPDPA